MKRNKVTPEIVEEAKHLNHIEEIPIMKVLEILEEKYNVAQKTLRRNIDKTFNVIIHTRSKQKLSKEELYDLYINKKMTKIQISKLKQCANDTITRLLEEYGISKDQRVNELTMIVDNPEFYGVNQDELRSFLLTFIDNVHIESDVLILPDHNIAFNTLVKVDAPRSTLKNIYREYKQKQIHIITIFEDEWNERNSQVKGFIKSIFQKGIPLRASKCSLKELPKKAANEFYEMFHIQGKTSNSIIKSYGLFHEDTLVAVMSFSSHHRQGHDKTVVLSRLCFHPDYRVHGGASRLFKHMKNEFSEYDIISWSDNRWSEGNVYKSLGFELDEELAPDYSYVKGNKRFAKQSMTKSKIGAGENQTEHERAKELGYAKIWDCGKTRWISKHK